MFIYTGDLILSWVSIFQLISYIYDFIKLTSCGGSLGWLATQVRGVIIKLDDGL